MLFFAAQRHVRNCGAGRKKLVSKIWTYCNASAVFNGKELSIDVKKGTKW